MQQKKNIEIKRLINSTIENNDTVKFLKESQIRHGILQEEMDAKLDTIIEIITEPLKKTEEIPKLKNRLKDHEMRIRTIEYSVKTNKP